MCVSVVMVKILMIILIIWKNNIIVILIVIKKNVFEFEDLFDFLNFHVALDALNQLIFRKIMQRHVINRIPKHFKLL